MDGSFRYFENLGAKLARSDADERDDWLDEEQGKAVEQEMAKGEQREQNIARLLKQGFRQFRLGVKGPSVWVVETNMRKRLVTIERVVKRRKGKKGQRLAKPRAERVREEVEFRKLYPLAVR